MLMVYGLLKDAERGERGAPVCGRDPELQQTWKLRVSLVKSGVRRT